jgi:hypothetical protein
MSASMARAYNEISLKNAIFLQAAMYTWIILIATASANPHLIWIAPSGGLAISLTINSIILIFSRAKM